MHSRKYRKELKRRAHRVACIRREIEMRVNDPQRFGWCGKQQVLKGVPSPAAVLGDEGLHRYNVKYPGR